MDEMVTITKKEYDSLVEDSRFLDHLRGAGVDNWEGYSVAINSMRKEDGEEED